jgi:hypothetical protein
MHADQPSDEDFYDRDMSDEPEHESQGPPPPSPGPVDQNVSIMVPNAGPIAGPSAPQRQIPRDEAMDDSPQSSQSSVAQGSRSSLSPPPTREPGSWSHEIRIPDSVTDASRHQLCMDRFFHPNGLMQPRDQDLSSLDANGKAWVMERPPLSLPIDGNTWSFVDECHAGITSELLKVLYFFDIVNGMSNHFHWNGFVVGTSDISGSNQSTFLQPSYAPNNKDVNGVMLSQYMEPDRAISFKGSSRGVDTGKLLSASELSASGAVYTPLELFRISISFTAGVFESNRVQRKRARDQDDSDDEDEHRQAIFGVVTVTALRNVDTLRLIMVIL